MSKIHRFIGSFDLSQNELEITGEIAKQILRVLKLKISEKIELCDGKGSNTLAKIIKINNKNVIVKLEPSTHKNLKRKKNHITLFCTILKKENFEVVVQKTTECGISKIIPIISDRTIKTGLNLERLNKIAKEASEQSGRDTVPEIVESITFEKSLEQVNPNDINILFDASGKLSLKEINPESKPVNIFIGPEGGWTIKEIEKAKNYNFQIATLGSLILRAETAAIVSTYFAVNI